MGERNSIMDTSPPNPNSGHQAFCSGCGLALEETDALPHEDRTPCPNCGGFMRRWPASSKMEGSPSLAVNSILIHRLDSARKYYSEILKPEYDDFFAAPATLRSAFRVAGALFHFRDWLFEFHRAELEAHFGTTLASAGALWIEVEKINGQFGFVRDVANASKHVRLKHHPSTSMTHVANTSLEVGAFDSAASDTARVKMKHGTVDVDFDECARALFRYWTELSQKIG
jgi:hypothetical protein